LPDKLGHPKSTHASCTVATDGERVFASFLNDAAIWLTALSLDGERLWQTKVGPFESSFGYAASPALFKSFVIVAADHNGGGYVAAVHRKTGEIQWRKSRPAKQSYASPLVANVAGQDQVLMCGAELVAAWDPNTGKELWSCNGTTMSCAGTMATNGEYVYATAGYPDKSVACYRADGSAAEVWKNNKKLYVPSLLVHDGYLYAANDDGIAFCWNAETGDNAWTGRLGGNFSASPVLAGDHIYVPNESGTTFVFKASPDSLDIVARNQLGDEAMASPVICGDRIYLRVASGSGGARQEMLYAIGAGE
jgi:outer membrane protein assembly factor BamB